MTLTNRFEIIETLGRGDFATVYRALDRELGREVAIKQIHQQYLQDPKQLERYWQEAQLLASLEHPHIMTIYDIVRERGWLVLELMQGSIGQLLAGRPISIDDLRMMILFVAQALHHLEQHKIYHGDVKPSNMMVDRGSRIKLGDFGMARRMVGDDGSLLKGTTKYMAPEVASEQFGPVGPHSDLYSLGFSAYELMCGSSFESLFPGLQIHGRDMQIAWMLWHAAPDRRLPEIARTFQGVPEDLAYVIQRLCEKDPAKRYRKASQVIDDLKSGAVSAGPSDEELQAIALTEKKNRRKRIFAISAFAGSALMTAAMFFIPQQTERPVVEAVEKPGQGTVITVEPEHNHFFLRVEGEPRPKRISVSSPDRLTLNGVAVELKDLSSEDELTIVYGELDGKPYKEIRAQRPEESTINGTISKIDASISNVLVMLEGATEPESISVPPQTPVEINRNKMTMGRQLTFTDLRPEDVVTLRYVRDRNEQAIARQFSALRVVTTQGVIESVDVTNRRVVLQASGRETAARSFDCEAGIKVSVNGSDDKEGTPLGLADLRTGDQATLRHHISALEIAVERTTLFKGVVQQIDWEKQQLTVAAKSETATPFAFDQKSTLSVQGRSTAFDPYELRSGDSVEVQFEKLADGELKAVSVQATPVANQRLWALIVAQTEYDDTKIGSLGQLAADARLVRDALQKRYRVPEEQLIMLENVPRVKLEQELSGLLVRLRDDCQLLVYFLGHGYADGAGKITLASKDTQRSDSTLTGSPMKWLVSQVDRAKTAETIVLMDSCHEASAGAFAPEPSTAEQLESLRDGPKRPIAQHAFVIASCAAGQRGTLVGSPPTGVFAAAIAEAYQGKADKDGDTEIGVSELFPFLVQEMTKRSVTAGKPQTPVLFRPDATPPRLSAEAQAAVKETLAHLADSPFEERFTLRAKQQESVSSKQPDVALAHALLLLRHGRTLQSLPMFESLAKRFPKIPAPYQCLAWQSYIQNRHSEGTRHLVTFVKLLPEMSGDGVADKYASHGYEFAGRLRTYVIESLGKLSEADFRELDEAIQERGPEAKKNYERGMAATMDAVTKIVNEIANANTEEKRRTLDVDRKRLSYYATIDFQLIADLILSQIDD
jgi:serine/threonine-protein kinase